MRKNSGQGLLKVKADIAKEAVGLGWLPSWEFVIGLSCVVNFIH